MLQAESSRSPVTSVQPRARVRGAHADRSSIPGVGALQDLQRARHLIRCGRLDRRRSGAGNVALIFMVTIDGSADCECISCLHLVDYITSPKIYITFSSPYTKSISISDVVLIHLICLSFIHQVSPKEI